MARIRSVHPGLFTDEAWVSCSPLARILYVGLWTDADDQGLFEWKPLQIKMRLLPGDGADAASLLAELVAVDLIATFEHGGKRFGAIKEFRKYQRPKKPNAIHFLPAEWRTYVHLTEPSSELDGDEDAPVPNHSPTEGEKSPQMEDGGGRGGEKGKDANASSSRECASADDLFEQLWAAYPHVKGRSSEPLSREALALIEPDTAAMLPGAATRYRREGQKPPSGPPALEKWLAKAGYRDWLTPGAEAVPLVRFTGPAEVREAFVKDLGEPWARSYIDPCGWQDVPDRALVPATATAGAKIVGDSKAKAVLKSQGLIVIGRAA